jgi:hypothetical protein
MDRGTADTDGAGGTVSPEPTRRRALLAGAGLAGAAGVASPLLRGTDARAATASASSTSRSGSDAATVFPVPNGTPALGDAPVITSGDTAPQTTWTPVLTAGNVIVQGALGDGSNDDTAAIQAALNATPVGGQCVFPMPPMFYLITAPLVIPNQVNVVGPLVTRPAKPRTSGPPSQPIIKASADNGGAGWPCIITDTTYTASRKVASGSSGGTIADIATWSSPAAGVLDVGSTAGFPASGSLWVANSGTLAQVNYTSTTGTQFKGCTFPLPQPGTGTVSTGDAVTNAAPSGGVTISGLVIDGSGITGTGKGHGIVLCGGGESIQNCMVQNVPGHGIIYSDANAAGYPIVTTATASQVENAVKDCVVYQPGGSGIVITNTAGAANLTDGYIQNCITDHNFGGSTTSIGIDAQNAADWRLIDNHVYALQGDGIHASNAGLAKIFFNQVDNWGQAATEKETYNAYLITTTQYGPNNVVGNGAICAEAASSHNSGANDYVYFQVTQSGSVANDVYFAGNSPRQISAGSGTSTAWGFTGGGASAPLNVWGFINTTMAEGPSPTPSIKNTVNFPDQ